MEHKNRIVSSLFFVALLCIYGMVDFGNGSVVITEKSITEEAYSEVYSKATMISAAIQDRSRRRSIQEQVGIGQDDVCAGILGSKWQKMTNQGPCPELVVRVPKTGFTEFVNVNKESKVEGGFSIAIFCHALQLLPYNIQPVFIPFVNEKGEGNGTTGQLLAKIKNKTCEAVAGDITIRFDRAIYIDFTIPYLSSEVYMLVHGTHEWNQTLLTFLKPFTWRLWITVISVCILIGVAIAILEYRVGNPRFTTPPFYQKLIMIIWFPISTFFFHEGKILNRCSKVVLVMWLSMIFIVLQVFTATLSSWLTINQLRPRLPSNFDNVGYQDGSFLKHFLMQQNNRFGNPVPLKSVEEYKDALSSGRVNAIVDELPYIELFLAKYGTDQYMKFGPISQESGIAFAFPRPSRLVDDFSRAVIKVTESEVMLEMMEKYLGFSTTDESQPSQPLPQSLDVQSFIGLFVFTGIVIIATIISSEISLMRGNNRIFDAEQIEALEESFMELWEIRKRSEKIKRKQQGVMKGRVLGSQNPVPNSLDSTAVAATNAHATNAAEQTTYVTEH